MSDHLGTTSLRAGSLGPFALAFLVLSAVGPVAAVFGASPLIFMAIGPSAAVFYLLAMGVFLLFAVGYVSMSRRITHAGGFVAYIAAAFDRRLGAAAAMVALVTYTTILASIYALFGAFAKTTLAERFGIDLPWQLLCFTPIIVVTAVTFSRVDVNAKVVSAVFLTEISLLLAFAVVVLLKGGNEGINFHAFNPLNALSGNVALAALWSFGSFLGFEATAVFSEEAKDPKKSIAIATYVAVLFMGLFFALCAWVVALAIGNDQVQAAATANPTGFIYVLGDRYIGKLWSDVMSIMMLVSTAAILFGFHNIVCRYVFALGRSRFLPSVFGKTHSSTQAPYVASIVVGVTCFASLLIFVLLGADPFLHIYPWLYAIGAVGMLLIVCAVAISVPVYFKRAGHPTNWFSDRFAPITAFVLLAGVLLLVIFHYRDLVGPDAPIEVLWSPIILPVAGVIGFAIGSRRTEDELNFTTANIEKGMEELAVANA